MAAGGAGAMRTGRSPQGAGARADPPVSPPGRRSPPARAESCGSRRRCEGRRYGHTGGRVSSCEWRMIASTLGDLYGPPDPAHAADRCKRLGPRRSQASRPGAPVALGEPAVAARTDRERALDLLGSPGAPPPSRPGDGEPRLFERPGARDRARASRRGRRSALLALRPPEPRGSPTRGGAAAPLGARLPLHGERRPLPARPGRGWGLEGAGTARLGHPGCVPPAPFLPGGGPDGHPAPSLATPAGALQVQRAAARRVLRDAGARHAGRAFGVGDAQAGAARLART